MQKEKEKDGLGRINPARLIIFFFLFLYPAWIAHTKERNLEKRKESRPQSRFSLSSARLVRGGKKRIRKRGEAAPRASSCSRSDDHRGGRKRKEKGRKPSTLVPSRRKKLEEEGGKGEGGLTNPLRLRAGRGRRATRKKAMKERREGRIPRSPPPAS